MTRREPAQREGQTWINNDQPTSWSVILVVRSEDCFQSVGVEKPIKVAARHRVLILDCGPQSGYTAGQVDDWYEYTDEKAWEDEYAYMRRIA